MKTKNNIFSVLICVKDAYLQVQECINSIIKHTQESFELILINDNSKTKTKLLLETYCKQYNNIKLITNAATLGYTKSLNIGLRKASTDFVMVLNSDVIVTPNWSKKLLAPMIRFNDICITSALSNAALWQSVPYIFDKEENYCINTLPTGFNLDSFSLEIEKQFYEKYAEVSMVNGFCIVIRKSLLNEIGYFNEQDFPIGYGEETDFCIRTCKQGYKILIMLDTYIYHHKSSSFGHEQRNKLVIEGNKKISSLYGEDQIKRLYILMKNHNEINFVRNRIRAKYYSE